MRRASTTLALLLLASCGELSNAPLRTGSVGGVVANADPKIALVSVIGHPELRAAVHEDGAFLLERVPAGAAELFVVADRKSAARLALTVAGAQQSFVAVQPEPGAFLQVELETPGMQSGARALLSLSGTPFLALPFEEGGAQRIGPLPAGCYDAFVRAPGLGEKTVPLCVQTGEERSLRIDFGGPADCAQAGCPGALKCASDGRCVECIEDAHCAAGFSCHSNDCVANQPVAACAPCTDDSQCAGGTCEGSDGQARLCRTRCSASAPCAHSGFVCEGEICQPNPTQFSSCSGYRHVGTPCADDAQCRAEGLLNGRCENGVCTLECDSDAECPAGAQCVSGGTGKLCLSQ